ARRRQLGGAAFELLDPALQLVDRAGLLVQRRQGGGQGVLDPGAPGGAPGLGEGAHRLDGGRLRGRREGRGDRRRGGARRLVVRDRRRRGGRHRGGVRRHVGGG